MPDPGPDPDPGFYERWPDAGPWPCRCHCFRCHHRPGHRTHFHLSRCDWDCDNSADVGHLHSHNPRCRQIPWVQDQSWRPERKPKPIPALAAPKPKGIIKTLNERFGSLFWVAIAITAILVWMVFRN
jgi:hypothetical protein